MFSKLAEKLGYPRQQEHQDVLQSHTILLHKKTINQPDSTSLTTKSKQNPIERRWKKEKDRTITNAWIGIDDDLLRDPTIAIGIHEKGVRLKTRQFWRLNMQANVYVFRVQRLTVWQTRRLAGINMNPIFRCGLKRVPQNFIELLCQLKDKSENSYLRSCLHLKVDDLLEEIKRTSLSSLCQVYILEGLKVYNCSTLWTAPHFSWMMKGSGACFLEDRGAKLRSGSLVFRSGSCVEICKIMSGSDTSDTSDSSKHPEGAESVISKLDFGDPLYLHPSDTSGVPILSFKLNGTENYKVWSCAMILALETKNKLGFVDGSCVKPSDNDVLAKQWDRCNAVVLSWILGSVVEELFLGQVFSKVASTVWSELKETYDKVDGSVTFNLYQKINSLNQNGGSVSDYYHKLNAYWRQFDALIKLPNCTCNASTDFTKHTQLIKLMQLLMGLDEVYQPIRSSILTTEPLPSVKTAFSIVSREESHRGVSYSNNSGSKGQSSAFFGKAPEPKRKPGFRNTTLTCKHCGANGHTIERCFKIIGFPKDFQSQRKTFGNNSFRSVQGNNSVTTVDNNISSSFSNYSLTEDQIHKLLSLIEPPKDVQAASANMADSGATQHMTSIVSNLTDVVDISDLSLKDLTQKKVVGIGNEKEGLYVLNVEKGEFSSVNHVSVCYVSKLLWHSRLGHPAEPVMNILKEKLQFYSNKIPPCDICHQAKQTRNKFENSSIKTTALGDLIHLDVWGPYRVSTKEGSEKCIFLGYCNSKKGYRLYSLDTKQIVISRDVRFYENIFPFKMKDEEGTSSLNDFRILKFFDTIENTNNDSYQDPNDDNRGRSSNDTRDSRAPDSIERQLRAANTPPLSSNELLSIEQDDADAITSITDGLDENDDHSPEGNLQKSNTEFNVRKSDRVSIFPKRFDEYVVEGKVKYGLEKVVNYSKLCKEHYCFVSNLNKSLEPTSYLEASKDQNWINAMNDEMEALNRIGTWELTDLPKNRKPIGSKWVFKIKYKSNGEIERYKARLVAKGYSQREGLDYEETFSPVVKMVTVRCLIALAVQNKWSLYQLDVNNAFLYGDLSEEVYMTLPEGLCMSQRKYCLELLADFGYLGCKPINTPMDMNLIVTESIESASKSGDYILSDISGFQRLIGRLIYLLATRPDISFVVHCLSQFMHSPRKSHLNLALRVLRYLKKSPGKGILFTPSSSFKLLGYVDADWGKCLSSRRSVTDCVFAMGRVHPSTILAETISWYCSLFLAIMLVLSFCESSVTEDERMSIRVRFKGSIYKPCDEIYVVHEGETLQTISEKCGDPYIVEENPHIHDPDDVFPGLIRPTPKPWASKFEFSRELKRVEKFVRPLHDLTTACSLSQALIQQILSLNLSPAKKRIFVSSLEKN
ncbi:hypothetical protein OSB04_029145 [Centaurea solstitialis]|uniref:Gag-pol polyprotein n=1 Tax=Centaurea solstitialis TaxID=347529 RepID=A0AA38SH08_9ASTR|nr:hypothetical protein OSB04_029145 [Centaurea solstitialis]